ncbi:MAG: hypothetical protein LBK23_00395 [Oscillospiraceae bacterium]|jgi:hypothetical protein|nr:hypothetical protein [Oscillospiraceae bacterium]
MRRQKTRKITIALLLLLCIALAVSCRGKMSTERLAKEVQASMLENWNDELGLGITVDKDLQLVSKGGNEYSGLITISLEGESEQITVSVIYDGSTFQWEVDLF